MALLVAAAGCGNDTTENTQQTLCQSLGAYQTALNQFNSLTVNSTMADIDAAEQNLVEAWNDVVAAAADYTNANIDSLQTAYYNLMTAINNIPSTDTVQQAMQSIQPQIQAVASAWQQLYTNLNCQQYQSQ